MAKLIITHDGIVIKEYDLSKEKITVGRKPSNDIVLDDPTVSGEHAMFLHMQHTYIEDMDSTNGIKLNGNTVHKRQLSHGDRVQIGQHEFKFIDEVVQDFESTVIIAPVESENSGIKKAVKASVVSLKGSKQGQSIVLNKPFTRLGTATQMAVIARRGGNYYLMPMNSGAEGEAPSLNGQQVGAESLLLSDRDIIEVAGTQLQFTLE